MTRWNSPINNKFITVQRNESDLGERRFETHEIETAHHSAILSNLI